MVYKNSFSHFGWDADVEFSCNIWEATDGVPLSRCSSFSPATSNSKVKHKKTTTASTIVAGTILAFGQSLGFHRLATR